MFQKYFKSLYQKAMHEAYSLAHKQIFTSLQDGGKCLDCGAASGYKFNLLNKTINLNRSSYYGIEWNKPLVYEAQKNNLNISQGDLNKKLQFPDNEFKCIFGLSVIEHLLNPCHYLKESYRILDKNGTLILCQNIRF